MDQVLHKGVRLNRLLGFVTALFLTIGVFYFINVEISLSEENKKLKNKNERLAYSVDSVSRIDKLNLALLSRSLNDPIIASAEENVISKKPNAVAITKPSLGELGSVSLKTQSENNQIIDSTTNILLSRAISKKDTEYARAYADILRFEDRKPEDSLITVSTYFPRVYSNSSNDNLYRRAFYRLYTLRALIGDNQQSPERTLSFYKQPLGVGKSLGDYLYVMPFGKYMQADTHYGSIALKGAVNSDPLYQYLLLKKYDLNSLSNQQNRAFGSAVSF